MGFLLSIHMHSRGKICLGTDYFRVSCEHGTQDGRGKDGTPAVYGTVCAACRDQIPGAAAVREGGADDGGDACCDYGTGHGAGGNFRRIRFGFRIRGWLGCVCAAAGGDACVGELDDGIETVGTAGAESVYGKDPVGMDAFGCHMHQTVCGDAGGGCDTGLEAVQCPAVWQRAAEGETAAYGISETVGGDLPVPQAAYKDAGGTAEIVCKERGQGFREAESGGGRKKRDVSGDEGMIPFSGVRTAADGPAGQCIFTLPVGIFGGGELYPKLAGTGGKLHGMTSFLRFSIAAADRDYAAWQGAERGCFFGKRIVYI